MQFFSSVSSTRYREAFLSIGAADLAPVISAIPAISPVITEGNRAQYKFSQAVGGNLITFPIDFTLENGIWKIVEY
jgi:hypothetical protein